MLVSKGIKSRRVDDYQLPTSDSLRGLLSTSNLLTGGFQIFSSACKMPSPLNRHLRWRAWRYVHACVLHRDPRLSSQISAQQLGWHFYRTPLTIRYCVPELSHYQTSALSATGMNKLIASGTSDVHTYHYRSSFHELDKKEPRVRASPPTPSLLSRVTTLIHSFFAFFSTALTLYTYTAPVLQPHTVSHSDGFLFLGSVVSGVSGRCLQHAGRPSSK